MCGRTQTECGDQAALLGVQAKHARHEMSDTCAVRGSKTLPDEILDLAALISVVFAQVKHLRQATTEFRSFISHRLISHKIVMLLCKCRSHVYPLLHPRFLHGPRA